MTGNPWDRLAQHFSTNSPERISALIRSGLMLAEGAAAESLPPLPPVTPPNPAPMEDRKPS